MAPPAARKRGVWLNNRGPVGPGNPHPDEALVDRVADFSYESDALAQLVVEMWLGYHGTLTTGTHAARAAAAKLAFASKGVYLEQPIVITEDEYDAGFSLADANLTNGIVFVLPKKDRATITSTPPALLETAKMLMAVTPNGI